MNLRELVRDVVDTSASADPHVIAKEVEGRLSDDELRAALRVVLPDYVRQIGRPAAAIAGTGTASNHSPRWDRASRLMRSLVFVGDHWKHLEACTAVDLELAAAKREADAVFHLDAATALRRLAALVGNGVVADLDPSVVASALEGS